MCGRYFFVLEESPAFDKLREKVNQLALFEYAKEEVFPSNQALVLLAGKEEYTVDVMKWGIDGFDSRQLINARSEGIEMKKTFQPMLKKRCLIPCNGFFEWIKVGKRKQKVFIRRSDSPLYYMAGIYNEKREFVIVTGESQSTMKSVHDRTPIIITEDQIPLYLQDDLDFEVNNEHLVFENLDRVKSNHEQLDLFECAQEEE